MAYFVLSPNGEESFGKSFLSPDLESNLDDVRGGPIHGDYADNTSFVKTIKSI